MKLGIFTDVHGDLGPLQKVLRALERLGAESLVCLGDLVVHGQRPNEVVALVRSLAIPTVGGNHDHGAVHYGQDPGLVFFNPKSELHTSLTQPCLTDANREYLAQLPDALEAAPGVCCVHACYRDRYGLLYARSVVEQVHADAPVPVTLSGHTHRTRIHIRHTDGSFEEIDPWEHTARTQVTFALNLEDANYILNCGNTSQLLFDRLPSVCGLLDTDEQTITWQRLH
ncbi:metallophosphoesterase family protein [Gloeobacter morelensis]|uniref:Metallophosphoesterase family protein n=1 Tax=Gloeobacter morelensis MG652769 TaxID=2781736 RepID=A0ABY3PPS2_9CYAN|nr:metallophosphoesterase family protein [Gloeobacter morelensis]UFP95698.1 metallophosphoesterase family protein [Gloeobacter morelensis MG652769]